MNQQIDNSNERLSPSNCLLPQSDDKKTIIVGVCGSIAAYKAAELISQLRQRGHIIFVIMTASAKNFITPLTLQILSCHPILDHLAEEKMTIGSFTELNKEENFSSPCNHIELADRADLLLIAPATANIIARLAHGFADDALSTVALATRAPLLIAPAMNGKMWEHAATRENVEQLRLRGTEFIGPASGLLACGYEGSGRMIETNTILDRVENLLRRKK